jgi:hypothetical protein
MGGTTGAPSPEEFYKRFSAADPDIEASERFAEDNSLIVESLQTRWQNFPYPRRRYSGARESGGGR